MARISLDVAWPTWSLLMSAANIQDHDDDLREACELTILKQPITDHRSAGMVCAVLLSNLECGVRSDALDLSALERLKQWHGAQAADPKETRQ